MEYSGTNELENLEKFTPRYNRDVIRRFTKAILKKSFGDPYVRTLDFGAGLGTITRGVQEELAARVFCLEVDPTLCEKLAADGFEVHDELSKFEQNFQFIYTSNVLEHIQDDVLAIVNLNGKLEPNGQLLIYVPAFPFLYSEMDEKVGHFRRYTRSELVQKLSDSRFKIETIYYVDSIGYVASIFMKLVGFQRTGNIGGESSLLFYDKYIWPLSKLLDSIGFKYLFGKNIFVVASKESH